MRLGDLSIPRLVDSTKLTTRDFTDCEDTEMLIFRLLIHIKRVKTIVKLLFFRVYIGNLNCL